MRAKYKIMFADYLEQRFYEDLLRQGMNWKRAVKETAVRFKAYDDGGEIIFVK